MSSTDRDRTVHAIIPGGAEIVRYDRSGKWYREDPSKGIKWLLSMREAVELACDTGAVWHEGRLGGSRFDAAVRNRRASGRV